MPLRNLLRNGSRVGDDSATVAQGAEFFGRVKAKADGVTEGPRALANNGSALGLCAIFQQKNAFVCEERGDFLFSGMVKPYRCVTTTALAPASMARLTPVSIATWVS